MVLGQHFSHQCGSGHCAPCALYYPSWEGKQADVHPHGFKTDSPWFMVCYLEVMFVSGGLCPSACSLKILWGELYQRVHYTQRPGMKYSGLRRLVGRKLYPGVVAKEESDIYIRCDSGKTTIVRCPPEEVFYEEVQSCKQNSQLVLQQRHC